MPPLPINNSLNAPAAEMQQEPAVHKTQTNANLPPELQNARPANRSILGRIASFLFGAGAAGGAAFGLGAGALLGGVVGSAALATGIATGGAALVGGALALGVYVGIKALVNHFRRAPDPEPRLQNMPQNNLPQDQPASDAFKKSVANAVLAHTMLPGSLQNTVDNVISQMRDIYGETLVPQGAKLNDLVSAEAMLADDIKNIQGDVTPAKLGEIIEKRIRDYLSVCAVDNALMPLCGGTVALARDMRTNVTSKYPDLLPALSGAKTQADVQEILNGHSKDFSEMVELNRRATSFVEGTKAKAIATIAKSAGLDVDLVASIVKPNDFGQKTRKLVNAVTQGKVDANAIEQEFEKLADQQLAKPYVDALKAVDEAPTLSAASKNSLKTEILTAPDMPNPLHYINGLAAGKNVDASELKRAFDENRPRDEINSLFFDLGEKVNQALKEQYGPEAWKALQHGKPDHLKITQGAAMLAILDKHPGLIDAYLAREEELDVGKALKKVLFSDASPDRRNGAQAAFSGYTSLYQIPVFTDKMMKMEKQTQLLSTIKSAEIPQELKTSWTEKVLSGKISEPAMVQSLIANVPNLAPETRPIMEQYILKQSYSPDQAQESAQKAQHYAAEMSGWRNFDTADDLPMAPVANWIKDDISGSLYEGQKYDNHSISEQMKTDVRRTTTCTINGEVMEKPDGEQVSHALRRALPTKQAAKFVSAIINQRSFAPLSSLGMQMPTSADHPIPANVLDCLTKMASRNAEQASEAGMPYLLHLDLKGEGEQNYTVTVQNGRAQIDLSETVGLDFGLGTGKNGYPQPAGKVRYTLHFECDLLGNDNQSPSIQSVHLKQEFLS